MVWFSVDFYFKYYWIDLDENNLSNTKSINIPSFKKSKIDPGIYRSFYAIYFEINVTL
jgi:hypothetical protein